jgi:hypothetical protein
MTPFCVTGKWFKVEGRRSKGEGRGDAFIGWHNAAGIRFYQPIRARNGQQKKGFVTIITY